MIEACQFEGGQFTPFKVTDGLEKTGEKKMFTNEKGKASFVLWEEGAFASSFSVQKIKQLHHFNSSSSLFNSNI